MRIILIVYFSVVILCAHVEWKTMAAVGSRAKNRVLSLTSPSGTSHFLWETEDSSGRGHVQYQKISTDGRLSATKTVTGSANVRFAAMPLAGGVSDDGQHIAFAFCGDYNGRKDIYFAESLDGGEDWTEPGRVAETGRERDKPTLFLEKDTGRVYVMYDVEDGTGLAVKEPKAAKFTQEIIVFKYRSDSEKHLIQTIDKRSSKRVFHLFTDTPAAPLEDSIDHFRSLDGGKNWTQPRSIASLILCPEKISVAAGTRGHIYIQYQAATLDYRLDMVWTKNYGETWERPIVAMPGKARSSTMAMCGKGSGERVFSVRGDSSFSRGFVKYLEPGRTDFRVLNYPFPSFFRLQDVHMSCTCGEDGKYTLALVLLDAFSKRVYIAYGTAHDL